MSEIYFAQPLPRVDPDTGDLVLDGHLPDVLEVNKPYRITKERDTMFGLLVKTDRLNQWVNKDWFRKA